MSSPRIYLDHAASTSVRPQVIERMVQAYARGGNAGALHAEGRAARSLVESAREQLAEAVHAHPSEVVFTSGGTEADNLAVIGTYRRRRAADGRRRRVLVSAIEHAAVLESAQYLARHEDAEVELIPVRPDGIVTGEAVGEQLAGSTGGASGSDPAGAASSPATDAALVSVMWVNNEIGTVADVAEIARAARQRDVPVHSDAVQAVGHVPVDFAASGLTTMALSGHKLGGPVGAGALLVSRDAPLANVAFGGGQERGLRPGTLAPALIVGLAEAVHQAVAELAVESARLVKLRDRLLRGVLEAVPGAVVTGAWAEGDTALRSAVNAHVLLPECDGDSLIYLLDASGVAASTGAACHAGVPQASHVVLALGIDPGLARGALRLSLGQETTDDDVDSFLAVLPQVIDRAQAARPAGAV